MLKKNLDPLSRNFDEVYDSWKRRYATGRPVSVNFRRAVGANSAIERFTHLLHPYPAKLLVSIPLFFLNCSELGRAGDTLLDPFCGSGTVLLEGLINGRAIYGCDTNPLARLISIAKTYVQSPDILFSSLGTILRSLPRRGDGPPVGPIDLKRWFSSDVLGQLDRLATAIRHLPESPQKLFMEVCLSVTVTKVSLTDPTISVPVSLNPRKQTLTPAQKAEQRRCIAERKDADVFAIFATVAQANIARMRQLEEHLASPSAPTMVGTDARTISLPRPADLVITSPPYGSAQKYIRACSLSLQWLGLAEKGLRPLERLTIGREHYNISERQGELPIVAASSAAVLEKIGRRDPVRQHIAATFLFEMHEALSRTVDLLRSDGHLVLVVGNNMTAGYVFDTRRYLTEICERLGLELTLIIQDRILSRGLITKRNSTAGPIAREWIMVFRKRVHCSHV